MMNLRRSNSAGAFQIESLEEFLAMLVPGTSQGRAGRNEDRARPV